jgi:hypothetical protein
MNSLESLLDTLSNFLNGLYGIPATALVALTCIVWGYVLRFVKSFPNNGIPLAVILWGAILLPVIADGNSKLPFRVWLVKNILVGLVTGFVAWIIHKQALSRLEDKFGLFIDTTKTNTTNEKNITP